MVKTSLSNTGGMGSISGRGVQVPHASVQNKTKDRSNIEINSIFLKTVYIKKKTLKNKIKL